MTPTLKLSLLALALLSAPALALEQETGSKAPEQKKAPQAHNHRGPKQLTIENADGATITLWKPDLSTEQLSLSHGGVTLPKTGMDNYHALVVEKDWGDSKETLIRYEYLFGPPSKRSPSELAGAVKADLEIVPAPIPREHFRYLSDQRWGFQARLFGHPKANLPLTLTTAYGSSLQAVTDAKGIATFRLPDDFPDVVPGKRDERNAEFSVSASIEDGGITYDTMLTAPYHINPAHWQSTPMGWAVIGIGFITGGLIGRLKSKGGAKS